MVRVVLKEYLGSFYILWACLCSSGYEKHMQVCVFVMLLSKQPECVCLCVVANPIQCTLYEVLACRKYLSVDSLNCTAGGVEAEYSIRTWKYCVFIVYVLFIYNNAATLTISCSSGEAIIMLTRFCRYASCACVATISPRLFSLSSVFHVFC